MILCGAHEEACHDGMMASVSTNLQVSSIDRNQTGKHEMSVTTTTYPLNYVYAYPFWVQLNTT